MSVIASSDPDRATARPPFPPGPGFPPMMPPGGPPFPPGGMPPPGMGPPGGFPGGTFLSIAALRVYHDI